jgi:mono/diheme cytochrome c family protein
VSHRSLEGIAVTLRRWIQIIILAAVVAVTLIAVRLHVAGGETLRENGNAEAGRHLAQAWCTECHSVERSTAKTGRIAPDFSAIADRRSTTALSLRLFLQSEHKTMPNFIIEPGDAADLVAYILSLRRRR